VLRAVALDLVKGDQMGRARFSIGPVAEGFIGATSDAFFRNGATRRLIARRVTELGCRTRFMSDPLFSIAAQARVTGHAGARDFVHDLTLCAWIDDFSRIMCGILTATGAGDADLILEARLFIR